MHLDLTFVQKALSNVSTTAGHIPPSAQKSRDQVDLECPRGDLMIGQTSDKSTIEAVKSSSRFYNSGAG